MRIIEIAEELHRDLGAPTDLSQPLIGFWLRENIGQLNLLIGAEYTISGSNHEISPELGENEKSILKLLFHIYYCDSVIKKNMGAAAYDSILEVTSDGATVRKANKNEISKTYIELKKLHTEELKKLTHAYKGASITPRQVSGDDTIEADLGDTEVRE